MTDKNSMIDKLQKAAAELFVLSFLMIEDSYPYQLVKDIKIMTHGLVEYSEAGLYPVISRLLNSGMISSYIITLESGRERTYYRIEEDGKERWRTLKDEYDKFFRISHLLTERSED